MAFNIFERWPWTSFQNLNLDWILRNMKEAVEKATEASESVGSFDDRITQNSNDIAQLLLDVENIARPLRIFVNSNLEVLHAAYPMTGGEIYDLIAGKEYLPFIEYLNEYYMLADIQTNAIVFQKLHIPTIGTPYIKILTIPLTESRAGYTIKEWTGGGGGGGSDDIRIVKITATTGGYTSDTAYAQIIAAMNAGQHIAMQLVSSGNVIMETATVFLYGNNNNVVFMNPQSFLNTTGQMNAIGMNSSNEVYNITGPQYITANSFLTNYLPRLLPVVSATDNGKFLRVVDGGWAAATVPAAEDTEFGP